MNVLCFFTVTATTEIYTYLHTLSLHDALPVYGRADATIGAMTRSSSERLVAGRCAESDTSVIVDNDTTRSEEHTSELQSLMRIPYAVFCLKKKKCDTCIATIININHNVGSQTYTSNNSTY